MRLRRPPARDLRGDVVLVTGAAGGIGLAAARALLARGAKVALLDLPDGRLDALAAQLGPDAFCHPADVTDRASLDAAVAAVVEHFGGIDAVAANAGILLDPGTVRSLGDDALRRTFAVNVEGPWNTVRATLPHVIARRGYYLLTSSLAVVINPVLNSPYAMSKAAVEQLARTMRVELGPEGVATGVCYWGLIQTPMFERSSATAAIEEYVSHFPSWAGRTLPPEQAGEAMAHAIATRAPRVAAPRYVHGALLLRDLVFRSDPLLARHRGVRRAVQIAEATTPTPSRREEQPV